MFSKRLVIPNNTCARKLYNFSKNQRFFVEYFLNLTKIGSKKHSYQNFRKSKQTYSIILLLITVCFYVFRVASVTGPFVVMIYKMIVGDILTFSYIYTIVLFGFSLCMDLMYFSRLSLQHLPLFFPKIFSILLLIQKQRSWNKFL